MPHHDDVATQEAWLQAAAGLPEDRRAAVAEWFLLQRLSAQALGLPEEAWWDLIEWAMKNPLDFSFIDEFPDRGVDESDSTERADGTAPARALVGSEVAHTAVADGPGIAANADSDNSLDRELFNRFMQERIRR
jgi:hypothetical protein